MKIGAYTVSLEELIAITARHKRNVTRPWINKYERYGLLPPQNKPGLGPGKGKPSNYTPALARQLVPLIQSLKLRGKNLPAVGWDLWWYDWYAEPRYWRELLLRSAKLLDQSRTALTPANDEDDRPFQLIREIGTELESKRAPNPMIGSAQRHNKGEISDLLSLMVSVFMGTYHGLIEYSNSTDNHERRKTERLLSGTLRVPIQDAQIRTDNTHFPVSVEALDEQLKIMSGQFDICFEDLIRSLPDEEINTVRQQLAHILWMVRAAETTVQQQYRRSAGTKALFWATYNQKQQAAFLIGWLVMMRNPVFKEQSIALFQTLRQQFGKPGEVPNVT